MGRGFPKEVRRWWDAGLGWGDHGITADPMVDEARAKQYFRTELVGRGIGAVYLKAENRSQDAAYVLRLQSIRLTDGTGVPGPDAYGKSIKANFAAANAAGMAGAALISFPMILASGKLTMDAMAREKNFVDKEWLNQSLSPGQSAAGFVYFQFPPKEPWPAGRSLVLECLNVRDQQVMTVKLPLAP